MYSNDATGVSLCFDVGLLQKVVQQELIRCVYLTEDILLRIQACLTEFKPIKISEVGLYVTILIALFFIFKSDNKDETVEQLSKYVKFVAKLKNCAYVDEDEIRLVQQLLMMK